MGWKLYYANPDGSNEQSVNLEDIGALEGGQVTGDGIRFNFNSHKASEVSIHVPLIDPKLVPKIPFTGRVRIVDSAGVTQFAGRRVDWDGSATVGSQGINYQFLDAWWDLSKITFKQSWWGGAYLPVSYNAGTGVLTFPSTTNFGFTLPSNSEVTANFYTYNATTKVYTQVAANWTITQTSYSPITATLAGGSGVIPDHPAKIFIAFQFSFTDVVLFQYKPGDPYSDISQVIEYYITTGAQMVEILNFAISRGVNLQIGEIDPSLYVPWYPVRCQNCAEALKVCLRDHPDCFTEIDYTTTPPTFHARLRANLTPKTLPYAYTDANGVQHVKTDVKPRPDLVPSRIGIFYRVLVQTGVLYPRDIWPVNAPDGLLALDYSIDLQGPKPSTTYGGITSVPFDPTNAAFDATNPPTPPNELTWWLKKCPSLATADISGLTMCNADGSTYDGSDLKVQDAFGNGINYSVPTDPDYFGWELTGGTQAFWMSNIVVQSARVTTHFKYQKKKADGTVDSVIDKHPTTVNVNLVNSGSLQQSYTQYVTTGEAIPANLARNIWESLQVMQYNLRQSQREEPFTAFIKPGRHSINLAGGNPQWAMMNATVQESTYTLRQRPDGVVWAMSNVSCGPVEHLEAGQLVQLFNIFANRDLLKIDPWERITGQSGNSSNAAAAGATMKENSEPGLPAPSLSTHVSGTADAAVGTGATYPGGQFSVHQPDARTSGLFIFKWNGVGTVGSGLNADYTRTPTANTPGFMLDLTDIINLLTVSGKTYAPVSGSMDDIWKLKAREMVWCDPSTGNTGFFIVLCGAPYTKV